MQQTATAAAPDSKPKRTRKAARKLNRRPAHTALDGRTWEYLLLQRTRADLAQHLGGSPSIAQRVLIERAAWLVVYLAQQDAKAKTGELMSEHAARQYLAWTNALTRLMRQLGLQGKAQRGPTLAEYEASKRQAAA